MSEIQTQQHLPNHVVIVSGHEGHARLDREMAKNLGIKSLTWFDSGQEAQAFISKNAADLVICDHQLADMDGFDFMREVRRNRSTGHTPLLMTSMDSREMEVLKAIAAGCSSYLVRPYTLGGLEKQMETARKIGRLPDEVTSWAERLRQEKERRESKPVVKPVIEQDTEPAGKNAREWCLEGNRHLQARKWDQAKAAFEAALQRNETYAEAHEGMARCWDGKSVPAQAVEHLRKATRYYAAKDRYVEAKRCFLELSRRGFRMHNPFVELASHRFAAGDDEGGLQALRRAAMLTPDDERVHLGLARAYMEHERSQAAMNALEAALAEAPSRRAMPQARALLEDLRRKSAPSWIKSQLQAIRKGFKAGAETLRLLALGQLPRTDKRHPLHQAH